METYNSARAFVDGLEKQGCAEELRALRNGVGMNGRSSTNKNRDDSRELALRLCRVFSTIKGMMEMSTWR
jgi:hypothetical protein